MAELIPFDYDTLRLIWWFLLGLLLIGFAVMDGFDIGVAMLLPIVGRTDTERRVMINVIAPVWEGNQVWLITGGGAIFAAWPILYAASFSTFYLAMMLLLLALILRPLGFKYRSKIADQRWRNTWDGVLSVGALVMALVFGVAMGNLLEGVAFDIDPITLRPVHGGGIMSLLGLFTPITILCGVVSILMCAMHGAILLVWRTDSEVERRARKLAIWLALLTAIFFALGGFFIPHIDGYVITEMSSTIAPSNPLLKTVSTQPGAWMHNFIQWPLMWLAPVTGVGGALLAMVFVIAKRIKTAFVMSSLSITGIILTIGFAIFPFLMPSAVMPEASLTIWDASASKLTLWIMLIATVIFLPIVISYTAYVYRVMRGKVTSDDVSTSPHAY